jgi:hypothetical protein
VLQKKQHPIKLKEVASKQFFSARAEKALAQKKIVSLAFKVFFLEWLYRFQLTFIYLSFLFISH